MKYTLGNSSFDVNGNMYLKDVGGYNGTNKDSSKDVATVIGGKIDSMINVTYSQLVDMRDNGELIPGQQYRIIDYMTTTSQEDTVSAGHQFDIVVTAISNNTLSEIASACLHEGDNYFSKYYANLSAWKIWYCLDNDYEIFEWADDTNGKGVIYRMIDEYGNDCPYDFKNIKFKKPIFSETDTPDSNFYYTFTFYNSDFTDSIINDYSLFVSSYYSVYNNVIKPYHTVGGSNAQVLNRILFIAIRAADWFYNNTFGYDCYDNIFASNFCDNTFGNDCYRNTFGYSCYDNTFGNRCHNNTFGSHCLYNTFGNCCSGIIFGTKESSGAITLKPYYRFIIIDNGNRNIYLNCTKETNSDSYYQNVRIGLGVNDTSTYKTIDDSNYNQDYETLYRPRSSKTITV